MASRKYQKSKNHAIEGKPKQMIMRLLPFDEPFEKSVIKATKVYLAGSGEISIDWGDGTSVEMHTLSSDDNNMSAFTHSYACKIVHTINIIGENITHLLCNGIGLTSIDVSTNYVLEKLDCSDNKLRSLNLSKNAVLIKLDCHINKLKKLNLNNNAVLKELKCWDNQLKNLDLSKNIVLTELHCSCNKLTNLDVSNNIALTELYCACNELTNLDVSKNIVLTELDCAYNSLTSLDIGKNIALTELKCKGNQITSLVVSPRNVSLIKLSCNDNQMTATALSDLFRNLPIVKKGEIHLYDNPGTKKFVNSVENDKGWLLPKTMTLTLKDNDKVTIKMFGLGYVSIDWGDGKTNDTRMLVRDNFTHTYPDTSTYNITIIGENITHLICHEIGVTNIDVSKNTQLEELSYIDCRIKNLDRTQLEKRLMELAKTKYNGQLTIGAMCYDPFFPEYINYVCPICGFSVKIEYGTWQIENIRQIEEIIKKIKKLGYDVELDQKEFCPRCCNNDKFVKWWDRKVNIKYHLTDKDKAPFMFRPELIFKIRFSGQSDYHVVRSNIVNEYSCLFAFLTQKEKYSSIRDEEYSLHDNINIIKKMTGLGNELI